MGDAARQRSSNATSRPSTPRWRAATSPRSWSCSQTMPDSSSPACRSARSRGGLRSPVAYAAQPPTDTMTILDTRVEPDGTVVEAFSWSADSGSRSGEMRLTVAGERIQRLVVVVRLTSADGGSPVNHPQGHSRVPAVTVSRNLARECADLVPISCRFEPAWGRLGAGLVPPRADPCRVESTCSTRPTRASTPGALRPARLPRSGASRRAGPRGRASGSAA